MPTGNESCPQSQTSEYLTAVEMKLKHILILQNKIDLVKESQAKEQYEQILVFLLKVWTNKGMPPRMFSKCPVGRSSGFESR